ncbi:Rhs element Vgr protein [Pantoea ananatis AJ13355]|uniref:Rhs element Vgr protein n=1 Tax=Pantoea ananatis (strain AJ13355) TaxID=932677 RepID=A0A0H3L1I7_PANAA|nr:Rhs element Vgr protein [Pantoea ananatis AJ13355]
MKRDRNLRIFQSQTVPQIVQTLLKEYGVNVETRLAGSYRVWEYCVQYQESSFDFISRLMELEGMYYFFRHEADKHTLVLCDAPDQHQAFPGYETIAYHVTPSGGSVTEEGVSQWALSESVTPGMYSTDDYDFRKPNAWMLQARQNPVSPTPGVRWTVYRLARVSFSGSTGHRQNTTQQYPPGGVAGGAPHGERERHGDGHRAGLHFRAAERTALQRQRQIPGDVGALRL